MLFISFLLRYIYTSRVEVSAFEVEDLLAILRLAHEYRVVRIQRPIVDYLKVTVMLSRNGASAGLWRGSVVHIHDNGQIKRFQRTNHY